MSAADRLRQAIEALPDAYRPAWTADRHWVCVPTEDGDDPIFGIEDRYGEQLAAYIALLASPTVGAALADLLDAVRGVRAAFNDVEPTAASASRRARNVAAAIADVERKGDALEQAIERSGQ